MKRIIITIISFFIMVLYLYSDDNELDKYMKITQNNPGNYQAYNKIGLILLKDSKYSDAKDYFVKAIIINNNYYDGYYNLGSLYYVQGDYNKAVVNFKRALSIDRNKPGLYVNIINCCLKLKKMHPAKEYYKEGIKNFDDESYKLLNCGGIIEMLSKNHNKAKDLFVKALKIKNDNKIKNNLAIAEYYRGNLGKAKSILKELGKNIDLMKANYKLIK